MAGERPGLGDTDDVTWFRLQPVVVREIALRSLEDLVVEAVARRGLDEDDDRLLHLVPDDSPGKGLLSSFHDYA